MLVAISSFTLVACKKDCRDHKVLTRNGLPIEASQEVPRKETKGMGSADVTYNKQTKVLTYKLTWTNLTGVPTGAHIHGPASRGTNAGIKHDFFSSFPRTISGTYSGSAMVDGVALIEDSLLAGKYYFNIHTAINPGGEIRGQIEF